jgi:hypothetical protein
MHFIFLWIDCAKARAVDSMSTDFSYGFGDTQRRYTTERGQKTNSKMWTFLFYMQF